MVTHSNRDTSYATKNEFLHDGNLVEKLVEEEKPYKKLKMLNFD